MTSTRHRRRYPTLSDEQYRALFRVEELPPPPWRYEITPTEDGGADVTESFALPSNPFTRVYWALLGRARGRTNERGMRQTLERIRAVLEA